MMKILLIESVFKLVELDSSKGLAIFLGRGVHNSIPLIKEPIPPQKKLAYSALFTMVNKNLTLTGQVTEGDIDG